MSRTTRCLFALGLSASLAAACGDDDAIIAPGGSGGTGGSGGSSGSAGDAGSGGDGGSSAGTGGSSAGTGGSSAGTGGSSAGTGGSGDELPDGGVDPDGGVLADGGPDTTPDGGNVTPPVDAGPEPIACPADLVAATAGASSGEGTQQVIITQLAFVGTDIQVTFRALADFTFTSPLQLCTGSDSDTDCDDTFYDLGVGDGGTELAEGDEVTFTTQFGDIIDAASGEIALINGPPDGGGDPIIWAYVNWGGYVSLDAPAGDLQSLEEAAAEEGTGGGIWLPGDSVDVNGQTTIYATGDVTTAAGFEVCTQDS